MSSSILWTKMVTGLRLIQIMNDPVYLKATWSKLRNQDVPISTDIIFSFVKLKFVHIYLEDILILLKNQDEHIDRRQEILTVLKYTGITLMLNKIQLLTNGIDYLVRDIKPEHLGASSHIINVVIG